MSREQRLLAEDEYIPGAGSGRGGRFFQRWTCQSPECQQGNRQPWYRRPYAIELQGGRCCSPQCLESAIVRLAADLLPIPTLPPPRPHRIPLGLLLLSRNLISAEQFRQAMEAQRQAMEAQRQAMVAQPAAASGRIGEWLVRFGAVDHDQIAAAVAMQWARPTFPLGQSHTWQQCRGWFPLTLMETYQMAPLHYAADRQLLYVGFTQSINFQALEAIRSIYNCQTEPCIVSDSSYNDVIAEFRRRSVHRSAVDLSFDGQSVEEIGALVRQHAQESPTRQIRLTVAAPFLWVRLQGEHVSHLTFRAPHRVPATFSHMLSA